MEFEEKIKTYCQNNRLIIEKDRILIGISGGADSVCLFLVMVLLRKVWNTELFAIHVNHQLRGSEAKEDEEFVRTLCEKYQVPLEIVSKDVADIARQQKVSEEEAGRNVRYQAFFQYGENVGATKIAVAHHKNDQAETVLHHLCRGSGIEGMAGIHPIRGKIIRPLLCCTRLEIEEFLQNRGQKYQVDSTNLKNTYTRNKLRNQVIPYLEREINTQTVEHMAEAAEQFLEATQYMEEKTKEVYAKLVKEQTAEEFLQNYVDVKELQKEHRFMQKRVLRKVLEQMASEQKEFSHRHIADMLALMDKQVGKKILLPYGIVVFREYKFLVFEKTIQRDSGQKEEKEETTAIILCNKEQNIVNNQVILPEKENILHQQGRRYCSKVFDVDFYKEDKEKMKKIPKNNCTKWFDYDKIVNTVIFRRMQEDDYLQIDEQGHRKTMKKFLKDMKVSARERKLVWVIAEGNRVLWVPGFRGSEYYNVKEGTVRILEVHMKQEEEE